MPKLDILTLMKLVELFLPFTMMPYTHVSTKHNTERLNFDAMKIYGCLM